MYFLQMHAATRAENNPPGCLRTPRSSGCCDYKLCKPTVSSNSHPGSAPGPGRLGMVAEEEAWHPGPMTILLGSSIGSTASK